MLGLADVNALVVAGHIKRFLIAPDDDMTQGHRRSAALYWNEPPQHIGDPSSVDFDHPLHDAHAPAAEECKRDEEQANKRRRQRPEIDQDSSDHHDSVAAAAASGYEFTCG